MKTIKEIEEREGLKRFGSWDSQNIGYVNALKDVLKLIDESYSDEVISIEELKQKIQGK